jgi:hypothetical protein
LWLILGFVFLPWWNLFLPELTTLGDCALEFQQSDSRFCLVCNSYFTCTCVACAVDPSVTMSSTDFTFQNLVFWELIWIFSGRNHFQINISHILNLNLTK